MYLYVKTTRDEYELPLLVADSARDLASMGYTYNGAKAITSKLRKGKYKTKGWHLVEVEDDDGETITV